MNAYVKTYVRFMMKKYQYLVKQYNKWYVEKPIPADVRHLFIHDEQSPERLRGKPKRKFSKCLHTDDKDEADILKKEWIGKWELEIRTARIKVVGKVKATKEVENTLRNVFKAQGANQEALKEVAKIIFPKGSNQYDDEKLDLLDRVTGKLTSTRDYVDEWLANHKYTPEVHDEARNFILKVFCKDNILHSIPVCVPDQGFE